MPLFVAADVIGVELVLVLSGFESRTVRRKSCDAMLRCRLSQSMIKSKKCAQGQRRHGARIYRGRRKKKSYLNFKNHHLLAVASHETEGHKIVLIII